MNLNNEAHFATSPISVEMPRSTFDRSFEWKGTSVSGKLVPFFVDEALPGDNYVMKTTQLTRMTTPLFPVMDRCFMDIYYFFVPWRILWTHLKEFFGENNSTYWTQPIEYTLPKISTTGITRSPGDIAHCMGVPLTLGSAVSSIVSLPFRAYRMIWNEWFRDQNVQAPKLVPTGDIDTDATLMTDLLPVNRVHDFFGSCLPGPQKGSAVAMALSGELPVTTRPTAWSANELKYPPYTSATPYGTNNPLIWANGSSGVQITTLANTGIDSTGKASSITGLSGTAAAGSVKYQPANLSAKLDYANYGIDVNTLRLAVQTQRVLEALALGGSRYNEYIQTFFGVRVPDARVQRPELIGSERFELNMQDNVQTTPGGSGQTPLSTVGAYSKTFGSGAGVNYSVSEYGYVIGVFCIRSSRSYSQGLEKMWRRTNMFSVYQPKFAHIGEQPVMKSEIYAAISNDEPFGWQEAFAEYRFKPNRVCGLLDPSSSVDNTGESTALGAYWTYADFYKAANGAPTLSDSWMQEGSDRVERTLAVQGEDQFINDIYVSLKHTRVMPVFSVPGLADHF